MKLLTQSGKKGNGNQDPDPDDIRLYEAVYEVEDETQENPAGYLELNIKGEETGLLKKLPPQLSDDESE
jgi:hypothetical protein